MCRDSWNWQKNNKYGGYKMTPTNYKVTEIRYKTGIYKLAKPVPIFDEGSFYRVDGTYIFDKFRIKKIEKVEDRLIFHMDDGDVIFTVQEK